MGFLSRAASWAFIASLCYATGSSAQSASSSLSDNGYTDVVQWDKYSLVVKGQRIFVHGGEFHSFRLPVPSLWPDIMQKFKAAGLNTVSIYIHWGLLNPSEGVLDFEGYRSVQAFLDAAKDAGLWVILRPGPYINAETTAGGLPHWVTSEVPGALRANSTSYKEAYTPYWEAIADITRKNSVDKGGPIILIQVDNEYISADSPGNPGKTGHFHDLQEILRAKGVVIPTTYNDPFQGGNFAHGHGKVDIYGLDSYSNGFDCSNPSKWNPVDTTYYDFHMRTNPDQPWYIPEFQGGSIDPWGPAPGYEGCRELTGPEYESVFHKNLWANNVKLLSYYMVYGGTSWAHIPFHKVYTSYDYGAAITEPRELTSKYTELKLQALFLRSAPEFITTDVIGNSTGGAVTVTGDPVYATYLKNPQTGAGFYIVRQADSTSTAKVAFNLAASTSSGTQQLNGISLLGRQSKAIVTDFPYGTSRALYSTASILFAGKLGSKDVLFIYGDVGTTNELAIKIKGDKSNLKSLSASESDAVSFSEESAASGGYVTLKYKPKKAGLTAIWDSDKQLILASDSETAGTFWSPVLSAGPKVPYSNFWQYGSNSTILIGGPYLVRDAKISSNKLEIVGDLDKDTTITIVGAPKTVTVVTFNGGTVALNKAGLASVEGILVGSIQAKTPVIKLPDLRSGWKYTDSLPEVGKNYSDANWVVADRKTTYSPWKPYYGDENGPVLYGCDYGYCEGNVLFRGHFKATGKEKAVNLTINGGEAFAASVWLNGKFIRTTYGQSTYPAYVWPILSPAIEETDETYTFPEGALIPGGDNVITVLHDNMGMNQTNDWNAETSRSPRGIRGYKLIGADTKFNVWKVQGKLGGYKHFPDKLRGVLNEGGFFAERSGFHLPNLPASVTKDWESRSPFAGLPSGGAGAGIFTKEFTLDIPKGVDAMLSFNFKSAEGKSDKWRGTLFVNGWGMGRVVANLGPQFKFPVHEGILNYRGKNTVALILWSMEEKPISVSLDLSVDAVYDSAIGNVEVVGASEKWVPRTLKA